MAVVKILRVGHPLLRAVSESVPITEIRSKSIKKLIRDMYDSMEEAQGLGLAASQIGTLLRIFVTGSPARNERYPDVEAILSKNVFINPEIELLSDEKEGFWEGCLSVPEMKGYVERPRKIRMKWYNEKEELYDEIIEGFQAVVYQHEYDHLDGLLYIDRLKDSRLFGYNDELDMMDIDGVTKKRAVSPVENRL